MKKTVKQESFDLSKITSVKLAAKVADVNIILTDEEKMTVTQYAKKKVTEDFGFNAKVLDADFTIEDNGQDVSWFLGFKGPAGISYEFKIPKGYKGDIYIKLDKGNVECITASDHKTGGVNIQVAHSGDIKLSEFWPLKNSKIFTARGNIDVSLAPKADCKVTGEALAGNLTISDQLKSGQIILEVKSNQGNITVK